MSLAHGQGAGHPDRRRDVSAAGRNGTVFGCGLGRQSGQARAVCGSGFGQGGPRGVSGGGQHFGVSIGDWVWDVKKGRAGEGRGRGGRTSLIREGARRKPLSTEGHGGTRRTANCFFVRGGRGGARRTAYTFFVHGGHGGRTENAENELLFCPRRTGRGAENGLHLFCPRRTRRGTENGELLLSAEDAEGRGELLTLFLSTEDTEGHGERRTAFVRGGRGGARRTAYTFFVHGGHGGARRTANCFFCPRRTRRGAENGERRFLVVSFWFLVSCERRTAFLSAEGAENCYLIREGARRKSLSAEDCLNRSFVGLRRLSVMLTATGRARCGYGGRAGRENQLCLNQDLRDSDGLGDGWRLVGET